MGSTPLNKGVLPTSTPIHPLGDSGYFSCDKLPFDGKLDTLSPIKEISNFKKLNERIVVNSPYIQVARELDFSNSVDFFGNGENSYTCELEDEGNSSQNSFLSFNIHLSDKEDKSYLKSEPINSDRQCCSDDFQQNVNHVNRTVSSCLTDDKRNQFVNSTTAFKPKNKVDFFEGFEEWNLYYITSFVLSLLPAEDLCRVSCVSKKWKKTVQHDVNANCRRKEFLKEKYSQKENQFHPPPSSGIGLAENCNLHDDGEHKTALFNMCNFAATSKQPLKQQATTKFESFVKEVAQGNTILMKCPKCNYAAKNQRANAYLCTKCNYAFCQRCLSPHSKSHICSKSKKVSIVVGSKQSKRNLKRL